MNQTTDFLVRKDQLATTSRRIYPAPALPDGQVRVAVERFALTANNITYAAFGDAMNYWQFFPPVPAGAASGADMGWGRIPVWGFGAVSASRHPGVAVGERLYGYFPMSSMVDLTPDKVSHLSFCDAAAHRAALHPVYNQYTRTATDPFYSADTEDLQALLRPLFITSWLIDDFLADNAFFGASADLAERGLLLLSSASSKTAYGTAFQLAQRAGIEVVGFTSPANAAFCESLGCYHRVLTYDQLDAVAASAPCVYIDFAGNAAFRKALHTHCAGLKYSCSVGGTHVAELGGAKDLPGPRATLFFAPAQIKKRNSEWGPEVLGRLLLADWQALIATVAAPQRPWLTVQQHRGAAAVQVAYAQVLAGHGDPRVGHMLSLA